MYNTRLSEVKKMWASLAAKNNDSIVLQKYPLYCIFYSGKCDFGMVLMLQTDLIDFSSAPFLANV